MSDERRTFRVAPHNGAAGCRRAMARGSCTCPARRKRVLWRCCGWFCGDCNKAIGGGTGKDRRAADAREET